LDGEEIKIVAKSVLSVGDLAIKHWLKRNKLSDNFYSGQITIKGDVTLRGDLEDVSTGSKTTKERGGSEQSVNTRAESLDTVTRGDLMTDGEIERERQRRAMANLRDTAISMAKFVLASSPTEGDQECGLYESEDDA
jgi:hypothetical protein